MSEVAKNAELAIPDLPGAIGKIMEHPELISMVASVLGGSSPSQSEQSKETSSDSAAVSPQADAQSVSVAVEPPADVMASLAPVLSRLSSPGSQNGGKDVGLDSNHRQLLCALKPYLSDSRKNAIDYILKISQMSGLLKGLR